MNLTRKHERSEAYEVESVASTSQFYAVMLATFIVGLIAMLSVAAGFSVWFGSDTFLSLATNNPVALIATFAVLFILTLIITIFIPRIKNNIFKLVIFPIVILFYGLVIGLAFVMYFIAKYNINEIQWSLIPQMIGIMLIPAGIMIVAAILGLFNLINIRALGIFSAFLFVGFLITLIVSLFVYKADWYAIVIGTVLISINMIIQWWQVRKTADMAQYMSKKDMCSQAIIAGIMLFISYAQLLWYIITLMTGSSRN
ncbi:MAG0110 family membrane protein [Mycoplasma sp. VS509_3]|uniref:MAG0110 family membrane protein n=1 Tax=unclassified Mycoplasma TaxID=2683645 RepID=UPI003AAFE654